MGGWVKDAFNSSGLKEMFTVTQVDAPEEARRLVEMDQAAAAIIIPDGFSAGLIPDSISGQPGPNRSVQVYANPARPISAAVVQAVVDEILNRADGQILSDSITIQSLLNSGRLQPPQAGVYAAGLAQRMRTGRETSLSPIRVEVSGASDRNQPPNYLSYLAPGMAILFLMYTVTQGGRSILMERQSGTLGRMLATPTSQSQVLAGKLAGIFLTGFLQVMILILATGLLFRLNWGSPAATLALVTCTVLASTGWGLLLAAAARTSFQVSGIGTAMMLLFGVLGGSFMPVDRFPALMRSASRLTPNAWALDGFGLLASGGGFSDLVPILAALLAMAAVLFAVAAIIARRRWAADGFAK
jgi:ABC-2 type transport system permease protein